MRFGTISYGLQIELFKHDLFTHDREELTIENKISPPILITQANNTTIEELLCLLEARDPETRKHSERVAAMQLSVAREMNVELDNIIHMYRGALLHDIGKIIIPDDILFKPDSLTDEEWKVIHQHPLSGSKILEQFVFLKLALDIPLYHHEKWDGTGYPYGLKGEEIPIVARIFAVVDVWDALCVDRPYRKAWPVERAIAYIKEQAGTHFDPAVVKAFYGLIIGGNLATRSLGDLNLE